MYTIALQPHVGLCIHRSGKDGGWVMVFRDVSGGQPAEIEEQKLAVLITENDQQEDRGAKGPMSLIGIARLVFLRAA